MYLAEKKKKGKTGISALSFKKQTHNFLSKFLVLSVTEDPES